MSFRVSSKIEDILANIDKGNFEAAVTSLELPDEKQVIVAAVMSTLSIRTYDLATENTQLKRQLAAYENQEDSAADEFIAALTSNLNDSHRAFDAQYLYNASWFASLQFSNRVKVMLAQTLVSQVSKHNTSYLIPLWQNII